MNPQVSIIMGSMSDYQIVESAAKFLDEIQIPFEINALSAHRTPNEVEIFAKQAVSRGIKVIIAAAGLAAHLPGVVAANTTLPVIGIPIKADASPSGIDAIFSILQMPPGIPVATVGLNAAQNAAILAAQIISLFDNKVAVNFSNFKSNLSQKVQKANKELQQIKFNFKVN